MREQIIEVVIVIVLGVVFIGALIGVAIGISNWLISIDWSSFTDTKSTESNTYTQQEPQQKTEGHCSILADKCIVNEWSLKCLWFDCIVDGRD